MLLGPPLERPLLNLLLLPKRTLWQMLLESEQLLQNQIQKMEQLVLQHHRQNSIQYWLLLPVQIQLKLRPGHQTRKQEPRELQLEPQSPYLAY